MGGMQGRENRLKRALAPVARDFDYVLIDTPPNLGVLTVNALIACTDVLIPIALTTYALIGINILEKTMQELRDNLDVTLPIFGVVANLDDHTRMSADGLLGPRLKFTTLGKVSDLSSKPLYRESVLFQSLGTKRCQLLGRAEHVLHPFAWSPHAYKGTEQL